MNIQKVVYTTFLDTRELGHKTFQLIRPLYSNILIDGAWYECIIAELFVTDFCSVPRVPLAYTLFGGKYNKTGTLHDALYGNWSHIKIVHAATRVELPITKKLADDILYQSLRDEGATKFTAWSMYQGVNVFGGMFYIRDSNALPDGVRSA